MERLSTIGITSASDDKPEAHPVFDTAIVGGGLAGLAMSILLRRAGFTVILFEKEIYPFHRVCGEYISMESWNFLTQLGIDLGTVNVSLIKKIEVSTLDGKSLNQNLPLGGFGISRYRLDHDLANIASASGVNLHENCKVNEVLFEEERFKVETNEGIFQAKFVAGSFGKRSNLDIKWKRRFSLLPKNKLNNYVGVKYHAKIPFSIETIALHLFDMGYCGIVKIEDDTYNICYLTTAENLKRNSGNIREMEKEVLMKNPRLAAILSSGEICDDPVTISQISFARKSQVENHVLMIGDAAGMITPLCGNGMSMALHGAKIASKHAIAFLKNEISRSEMEVEYEREWKKEFASRLKVGRFIQRMFSVRWLTNVLISVGRRSPAFMNWLIKKTHGSSF